MNQKKGQDDDVRFRPHTQWCTCGIGELRDDNLLDETENDKPKGIEGIDSVYDESNRTTAKVEAVAKCSGVTF